MVAPWGAKAPTPSRAGMDAAVRPASPVSTTLWLTPGTVSSRPTRAAAAATEETPGTISHDRCSDVHQSICSAMAP